MASGGIDETTIDAATRCYVRPMYSSVDPANDAEPRHSLINARSDLFKMFEGFLSLKYPDQRHLLVLADSGMGKTSFLINYFNRIAKPISLSSIKVQLVSLSQESSDDQIRSVGIAERKNTNLFLDALDEDQRATNRVEERIEEILTLTENYRTVTITCRSQFFRSDNQIPVATKLRRIGPVPLNQSKHYEFIRVYIAPFDDDQIDEYLRKKFPGPIRFRKRSLAKDLVKRVPSLSVRPMLLSHTPELIESGASISNSVDVYEVMVNEWARRESSWLNSAALLELSEWLATDLYQNRLARHGEFIPASDLEEFAQDRGIDIRSDLVTSRSLLNRTHDGKYKFAHRSIMEYFFVVSLLKRMPRDTTKLTDQMARFFTEKIGISSTEVDSVISYCNLSVSFVDAGRRLGQPTNFNLFRDVGVFNQPGAILSLPVNAPGLPPHVHNLDLLINDMSNYALGMKLEYVQESRVVIVPSSKSGRLNCSIFVSVWVNSYGVLLQFEAPVSAIPEPILGELRSCGEVALVKMNSRGVMGSESWRVTSRATLHTVDRANLFGFLRNPAVGVSYFPDENSVNLAFIRLPPAHRPLAGFGVLGTSEGSSVAGRPYTLLSATDPERQPYN